MINQTLPFKIFLSILILFNIEIYSQQREVLPYKNQKTLIADNAYAENFRIRIQDQLDSLYNESTDFAGATIGIALPEGDKFGFAVGYANMDQKILMQAQDRMLGGSSGKIFVSAAIMQLVENNKIKLDDKIEQYLGSASWYQRIQNYDQITIRNIMQHASGISRYVFEPSFQVDIHKDADRIWKPEELLSYVFDKEPLFDAGTEFAYADTNYIILAMILEKVSEDTMYGYIDKNILIPFGLTEITPQINREIDGLVQGYNKEDDEFYPGKVLDNGVYKYNVQFEWAGGGYVMNALDLASAGKLIYESKVFDESLMDDFFKGIDAKRLGGTWGLGVHIKDLPVGKSYGHSGFFPGYVTNMLYFPEYEFAIAFQVNTSDGKQLGLFRKMYQLIPTVIDFIKQSN